MKSSSIKKEQKQSRSKKAAAVDHPQKKHLSRLVEEEAYPRPMVGRFGKKWFPYHK